MKSQMKFFCMSTFILLVLLMPINRTDVSAASLVGKDLYIMDHVSIEIDGEQVIFNDPILNKSGHILLPMRNYYEALGAQVQWNNETQTASAIRDGKVVNLTINSKEATVDGKNVSVNVPPMLHKDRTYVPLRFVSENLNDHVYWNETEQKVEITTSTTNPAPPESPYILHVNNKKIIMADPIIFKEGRTYIPADYFIQSLENASWNYLSDKELELQIAGFSFVFSAGGNMVLVNQEPTLIQETPFIQSGKMYVPVNFIVESLGKDSSIRYINDKRELYIYINHYMFTSKFLEKSYGSTITPELVPNARLEGNRQLLISDNPEVLNQELLPDDTATLAQHNVQSSSDINEHRVFGWHTNQLGKNVTLGITIQNTSKRNSIQVSNAKGVVKMSGNDWYSYDIGLPIADQVLNEKMNKLDSTDIMIQPGETKIINSFELESGYATGFLHDFDIRPVNGGNSEYIIRTVLAKNDVDLSEIHSEQVSIDWLRQHPRGVWPQSTIVADLPAYTVGSPEVGYNLSNGKTDHFQTEENSLSALNGSRGNPGHFGIVYKVNIPIANQTGEAQVIKLKLAGRGGLYSGAVKVNGEVYLVPTLKSGTEYVYLPDITVSGSSETINLEIMHAGGIFLPAAIYIESQ